MFYPAVSVFFRYFSRGARLLRLVLFHPPSARFFGYFYNDTLCNVNYCWRNELEEVFQDAVLQHFSHSLLSRYYPPSLSVSLPLVSGAAECQRAPLSSLSARIPRESPHFHGADLVKGLVLPRPFAPC